MEPKTVDRQVDKEEIDRLEGRKTRIDEQEYEDTNRKLSELMTLYNAQIQNPNETRQCRIRACLERNELAL